jgi:hypothetical protein
MKKLAGKLTQSLALGGVKRTSAMTGLSNYPIRMSMVYPPPLNNRASVACTFEDATTIRAAEEILSSATFRWQLKSQQMRLLLSVLSRVCSNNSVDLSSSSIAWASFLTPRWSTPIISTPRGDKASLRSKTSSPSKRGPNGSRSRCVMR